MTVTNYIYDGFQLLCETDENNNVTRRYINEPDEFTHPIGHVDEDTGKPSYYHYDGQGNTRAVTDENGDVTDTFDYDSWGNLLARTGMTNVPFQFGGEHGYYKDEELGTFYVMARSYDPSIARWLSADPLGFVDGDNLYLYVQNNPVSFYDPSGTKKRSHTLNESVDCDDTCAGVIVAASLIRFATAIEDELDIDPASPTGQAIAKSCIDKLKAIKKLNCGDANKDPDVNKQPVDVCGCIAITMWLKSTGGLFDRVTDFGCDVTSSLVDCECGNCPLEEKEKPAKNECKYVIKKDKKKE